MAREVCRQVISDMAGREVSEKEAVELMNDVALRAARLREADGSLSANDALSKAGSEFATQAEMKALAQKRNTLLNMRRRVEAVDYLRSAWKDNPVAGLKALLVGVQGQRMGARLSAGAEISTLSKQYIGGLLASVEKATDGGIALLTSGEMDDDIARALWQLNSKTPDFAKLDDRAVAIARAVHTWQEVSRLDANRAGAFIGKTEGYIVRQSHDAVRISADRDAWQAMARDTFDLNRMLGENGDEAVQPLLDKLWQDLADGVHLKVSQPGTASAKGLRGMARGLSHERVIHFKSADDWMRYNADFGAGNLREALVHGLEKSARATGLMRVLGPNHEMVYADIVKATLSDMKKAGAAPFDIQRFQAKAKSYQSWYLNDLDGTLDIPGNNALATRSAAVRAVQSMASLGGSTLSSISDLATMMRGATSNGGNAFEVIGKGLGNLFSGVPKAERLEMLADLGMAFDSLSGKLATGRFSIDDGARGMIGSLQQKFFTMNLQNRWTDSMRQGVSEFLSANLARRASNTFDGLPPDLQGTLGLYGIDAGKWDIIRAAGQKDIDGQHFLTPSGLSEVDDAAFAAYLVGKEVDAGPRAVAELRHETARQLRNYFNDQNGYLLLTPDFGTSGLLKMGTAKGTVAGEGVRFMMQFKSFSFAFSQKSIGREYAQHGLTGVAKLVALTTVFGYMAGALKDMSKGLVPRDPHDPRTWVAALQQGGGAGIYGDVLFSQVLDRRYSDAGLNLLGPTASDILGSQGILNVMGKAADAAQGNDNADPGAAAVKFVKGNTPFLNLFYTRLALDYMVFWHLQEMLNPGSLNRMEKRVQDETGRQYMVSPSETVK